MLESHTHQEIIAGLLRMQASVTFAAGGPSMNPTIRSNDHVHARPVKAPDMRPGVMLVYWINQRLVVHRLIRIDQQSGTGFFIGDAATSGGDTVSLNDVIGLVTWIKRGTRVRRVDTICARAYGLVRYLFRPVRRQIINLYHRFH